MPHNPHEILYQRLSEITDQVRMALKDADPDEIMSLAEDHRDVMSDLLGIGACDDINLVEKIQVLHHQIQEVIAEIRQRRLEVLIQIQQMSDGKKMVHAYTS